MATLHSNLLLFTSMLALLAPLLALKIENLERLQVNLEDIININTPDLLSEVDEGEASGQQSLAAASWLAPQQSNLPRDCSEVQAGNPSGIYAIQPTGSSPIVVYCEMEEANGTWTVIQRNRQNTDITWGESWSSYKHGFGNVQTEFWLGTEYIRQITRQKLYRVRFLIWDASNNKRFADYNLFSLDDESQGYRLRLGAHSGTAEDAMASKGTTTMHDNMKFSTKDRDQDTSSGNCASVHGGGWWFSSCYSVRLNIRGGLAWGNLCRGNCSASAILIKPLTC